MNSIDKLALELQKAKANGDSGKKKGYDTQAEVTRLDGNTVWVKIAGGDDETPVSRTNNANIGDNVLVRISGGRAWLLGNQTNPATDDTVAKEANQQAYEALGMAASAGQSAELARTAADVAVQSAERAQESADRSEEILDGMRQAAEEADTTLEGIYQDAKRANNNADAAQRSADETRNYAYMARSQLGIVEDVVGVLELVANNAEYGLTEDTVVMQDKWYFAQSYAYTPVDEPTGNPSEEGWYEITAYDYGLTMDTEVVTDKSYYIRSGEDPNYTYTLVDNPTGNPSGQGWYEVTGVEYGATTDTIVVVDKTYYSRAESPTYSIVNNPVGNPLEQGWYEITNISDAIKNYVSSHLVLDENGLWIQHGASSTKALMSPTQGFVIYNNNNEQIARYGEEAIIGNEADFHIKISGGENSEIGFYQGEDNKLAYINGNELYVQNSLSFGSSPHKTFSFYQRPNGHFTLDMV